MMARVSRSRGNCQKLEPRGEKGQCYQPVKRRPVCLRSRIFVKAEKNTKGKRCKTDYEELLSAKLRPLITMKC